MRASTRLLLMGRRPSVGAVQAPLTATTTTTSESVTLRRVSVNAATAINWGDGNTETITGVQVDLAHTYATAGTYAITFDNLTNLTSIITFNEDRVDIDTSGLQAAVNLDNFIIYSSTSGVFKTEHMRNWSLGEQVELTGAKADLEIVIDSADLAGKPFRFLRWRTLAASTNASIRFDTGDIVLSQLANLAMQSLASLNPTLAFNNLRSANKLVQIDLNLNGLSTAQCDAVIEEFWQQAVAGTRTRTGGRINISSNSPITGAIQPPSGGAPSTTGEKVYELVNDSGARGFNTWTTITVDTA